MFLQSVDASARHDVGPASFEDRPCQVENPDDSGVPNGVLNLASVTLGVNEATPHQAGEMARHLALREVHGVNELSLNPCVKAILEAEDDLNIVGVASDYDKLQTRGG